MKRALQILAALIFLFALNRPVLSQTVPVMQNLWRLVTQEDTDGDKKITVHDRITPFELKDESGRDVRVITNEFPLSVLLQNLKQAEDDHQPGISLSQLRLDENIVDRTHRLIKNVYWGALTRRIDAAHVDEVVHDPKVISDADYIYVPAADKSAVDYFEAVEKNAAGQHRSPPLKV